MPTPDVPITLVTVQVTQSGHVVVDLDGPLAAHGAPEPPTPLDVLVKTMLVAKAAASDEADAGALAQLEARLCVALIDVRAVITHLECRDEVRA